MTNLYQLRQQLAQQDAINQDLNERLLAAEAELKAAQKHREAMAETQRQSQLEAQAIAEFQGHCQPGLERQLLTVLRGEGLLVEADGKIAVRTPGEWHESAPISERVTDILENQYPHFKNPESKKAPASERIPQSYENLRSTKDILEACRELDGIHRQQQQQRYEAQVDAARGVSEQFQEGVPTRATKTLSPQELRRRLFEEQKGLA